jgi:hypothetical protein
VWSDRHHIMVKKCISGLLVSVAAWTGIMTGSSSPDSLRFSDRPCHGAHRWDRHTGAFHASFGPWVAEGLVQLATAVDDGRSVTIN